MIITSTDPIADMLTRIRNAIHAGKHEVDLPYSKTKEAVARLLQTQRFIDSVNVDDAATLNKSLKLVIHDDASNARITEIVRLSRPGRRVYAKAARIPIVKRGRGIVIISTSKGLMTGSEAKSQGIGGELICKVY